MEVNPELRVAIVHYWLTSMRGGERVLEHLCDIFPNADIYTHVVDVKRLSPKLLERRIYTTFIARLPFAKTLCQKYLPLMPRALEMLDLSAYELVISCEAGPAKGVITRPDALHVTYCHSPMRYIWDQFHQYWRSSGFAARVIMWLFAPSLRAWDVISAARVDVIIANSAFVKARISKFWRRESVVVHPPVDSSLFALSTEITDEYIWVGQLVPYKCPDIAIEAFNVNGRKLHIIGDGPMYNNLRKIARSNIRFTRRMSFDDLRKTYATARALIFTSEEDFGLIPIEVMASGRPVLAYGRGGATETIVNEETGLFFHTLSAEALNRVILLFDNWVTAFNPQSAIIQASKFSVFQFRAGLQAAIGKRFIPDRLILL